MRVAQEKLCANNPFEAADLQAHSRLGAAHKARRTGQTAAFDGFDEGSEQIHRDILHGVPYHKFYSF